MAEQDTAQDTQAENAKNLALRANSILQRMEHAAKRNKSITLNPSEVGILFAVLRVLKKGAAR